MHNDFDRVLALVKYCRVPLCLQVFIPLYKGMKETLERCQHIKESLEKLNQSSLICCLILLMSYEGMYLNHFLDEELTIPIQ